MPGKNEDAADKDRLKDAVRPVILAQGNIFIKELLRKHNIKIGTTKADFAKNLLEAIGEGTLTRPMIEAWLAEVEGWGNQHIYLFRAPSIKPAQVQEKLGTSRFASLAATTISHTFPDDLELSTIWTDREQVSIGWHKGLGGWERAIGKDYERSEDGELYKYQAYRRRFDRSVVRFAWRYKDPFCAIAIQLPLEGDVHDVAHALVRDDLKHIGIFDTDPARVPLSAAFKKMTLAKDSTTQSARLMTDGGHIDVVATSSGGIAEVEPLRHARRGMDDKKFAGADGVFNFLTTQHGTLTRDIKVQGFGLESRIRIGVQCKREDVYLVLAAIWKHL